MRVAIIGSGIAGLGAAWSLNQNHDVTLFEADGRLGGHANTVEVDGPAGPIAVDTGFIVYNEVTYPHLTNLFSTLGVDTEDSDMSFSLSLDREMEYGASLRGILAQPSNLLRSRFRKMLFDIDRFRRVGSELQPCEGESIRELLERHDFSVGFIDDYLVPMTGAIWSARPTNIADFPAQSILNFLRNHGLITIKGRPTWRTVTGGSRQYVGKIAAELSGRIRLRTPVVGIDRSDDGVTLRTPTGTEYFDEVVIAAHSDQALSILGDAATDDERQLLKAIPYEPNVAVLHSDQQLMPLRRGTWSSWNAMVESDDRDKSRASVTYWMNRLQNLDPATPLFVSLNPITQPDPALVHGTFNYAHPQFDSRGVDAQREIARIQGANRTWFAGAWLGYGFHEDGLQSGLHVAAALGAPAPWYHAVTHMSSAPPPAAARTIQVAS